MTVLWRTFTAWQAAQSAHHGLYSISRLQALQDYIDTNFTAARFLSLVILASWPCIVTIVLIDVVPLDPPNREVKANSAFWARSTFTAIVFTLSYVQQTTSMAPMLELPRRHVIGIALVATAGAQACHYAFALSIGFPVPFSLLLEAPAWFLLICGYFTMANLHHICSCPKALACLVDFLSVSTLSMSQLAIYPLCSHIFAVSSPTTQIGLSLLLHLVKNVYRFAIGHFVREMPDRKARVVTFHAEIAHSLFMTFSLQRTSSILTLAVLLTVDLFRSTLTLLDVYTRIRRLNKLEHVMNKDAFNKGSPLSAIGRANSIVTGCRLESKFTTSSNLSAGSGKKSRFVQQIQRWRTLSPKKIAQAPTKVVIAGPTRAEVTVETRIVPIATGENISPTESRRAGFGRLLSPGEAEYVEGTLQLLRLTEFAILSELIEFLVPAIYSKSCCCLLELHSTIIVDNPYYLYR